MNLLTKQLTSELQPTNESDSQLTKKPAGEPRNQETKKQPGDQARFKRPSKNQATIKKQETKQDQEIENQSSN
jgi:hypothetical protein